MKQQELIPHLFRTEYRKIVSVLCKRFGFAQIQIAEDLASETFLTAAQVWGINGLPEHPVAWLYRVARNKGVNHLQRSAVFEKKIVPDLKKEISDQSLQEIDLSPQNINDSQLQMMFAICNPSISSEAQIGLSLRILCGFGIEEIADAFLTSGETINKRLYRAREKLRAEKIRIEFPAHSEIERRLENVLTTIYLLFNEGYFSESQDMTIRKDLCLEAMRLCNMLIENKSTNNPAVNALMALMCFQASRFEARIDNNGLPVLYDEQDVDLWNVELISQGSYFLHVSSAGKNLSKYHLEATIAYWSTQKADTKEKWNAVLHLYDLLLQREYSSVVALNRIYALSKVRGKEEAIKDAEHLNLTGNQFYYTLLGELYTDIDDEKALNNFQLALALAKTETVRLSIQRKMERILPEKK
jgi:RNA polymerase sigma factor (sigma-70 family)